MCPYNVVKFRVVEVCMTPEELAEFKRLLAKYLDMQCVHCGCCTFEDRHIVTCTDCGEVMGDLKVVVRVLRRYEVKI